MLKVNAKYKLITHPTIDTVTYIELGGTRKELEGSSTNTWEGVIKEANANDRINVALELGGYGNWKLEVSVIELTEEKDEKGKTYYVPKGEYKKITPFPIDQTITGSIEIYDKFHSINW